MGVALGSATQIAMFVVRISLPYIPNLFQSLILCTNNVKDFFTLLGRKITTNNYQFIIIKTSNMKYGRLLLQYIKIYLY